MFPYSFIKSVHFWLSVGEPEDQWFPGEQPEAWDGAVTVRDWGGVDPVDEGLPRTATDQRLLLGEGDWDFSTDLWNQHQSL